MLPMKQLNLISRDIIGCAIKVHRTLGPGLLESVYVDALCIELEMARIRYERGTEVPIVYAGRSLSAPLKLDLLVANEVIVEAKAVQELNPVHEAQLLTYLRLTAKTLGLLINFNTVLLKEGIRRKILNPPSTSAPLGVLSDSVVKSCSVTDSETKK
ncbi:MAG TPA: GxxExxY protein [Planctomycetota bacterium]|nr:GxxExxY protein [Planctomycetota bacterium]